MSDQPNPASEPPSDLPAGLRVVSHLAPARPGRSAAPPPTGRRSRSPRRRRGTEAALQRIEAVLVHLVDRRGRDAVVVVDLVRRVTADFRARRRCFSATTSHRCLIASRIVTVRPGVRDLRPVRLAGATYWSSRPSVPSTCSRSSQFIAARSLPGRIGITAFTQGALRKALRMLSPSSCSSQPSELPSLAGARLFGDVVVVDPVVVRAAPARSSIGAIWPSCACGVTAVIDRAWCAAILMLAEWIDCERAGAVSARRAASGSRRPPSAWWL